MFSPIEIVMTPIGLNVYAAQERLSCETNNRELFVVLTKIYFAVSRQPLQLTTSISACLKDGVLRKSASERQGSQARREAEYYRGAHTWKQSNGARYETNDAVAHRSAECVFFTVTENAQGVHQPVTVRSVSFSSGFVCHVTLLG